MPGVVTHTAGGVARNIAVGLAQRLGCAACTSQTSTIYGKLSVVVAARKSWSQGRLSTFSPVRCISWSRRAAAKPAAVRKGLLSASSTGQPSWSQPKGVTGPDHHMRMQAGRTAAAAGQLRGARCCRGGADGGSGLAGTAAAGRPATAWGGDSHRIHHFRWFWRGVWCCLGCHAANLPLTNQQTVLISQEPDSFGSSRCQLHQHPEALLSFL